MRRLGLLAIVVATIGSVACGGGSSPPGSADPGKTGEQITGRERLGWTQAAADANEVSAFGYVAYVDGNRTVLAGVNCASGSPGSFNCSSRMPSMSAGSHTLELASFITVDGVIAESNRSPAFRVTLAAATAGADADDAQLPHEQTTSDGVRMRAVAVARDIEPPSAMAFAADGTVFFAERRGRIVASSILDMNDGAFVAGDTAFEIAGLYVTGDARGGVIDLVLDPQFERTRYVYALYVVTGRDGAPQFEIARFREAGRRLGERVVLFDRLPASPTRPAGALEFGPDGKLYAAFDDGGDPARASQASAYNAKVLRLNADGTTPSDRPSASPVFSSAYSSPRGLDWQSQSNTLWIADRLGRDSDQLRIIAETARLARGQSRAPIVLPSDTDTSSMTFYRGDPLAPFHGDLFIAGADGLLRLRFDRRDSGKVVATEHLFAELLDDAISVAVGPDGALYLGARRTLVRIGVL
ncbi:MAG TPA: PQQ-dependent sugar dehydrogenase [Vicinamibacterales bacterium]|nr:PQQ-dependent sugar dehydrogenase [Vicinamibacterales bacterium]